MAINITDPLLKKLYGRIVQNVNDRAAILVAGSALTQGHDSLPNAANVGMSYKAEVYYIRALQETLDLIIETDHNQYGTKQDGD